MRTWELVAGLPIHVEGYALEPHEIPLRDSARRTTVIRLEGAGHVGVGEDVSYDAGAGSDTVAVRGFVATEPRHLVTEAGLPITSFRLVTTRRRYNRQTSAWEDGGHNWYTVSAFRKLALGAAGSIEAISAPIWPSGAGRGWATCRPRGSCRRSAPS